MSKLLHLTNRFKAQANKSFLTPTQQAMLYKLQQSWQFPEKINLYGSGGSGKTFLGWVLARQQQAMFYASPRRFFQDFTVNQSLIIDNAPIDEPQLRGILAELQLRNINRALFITHAPIRVPWPSFHLPTPTPTDIQTVYDHCGQMQYFTNTPRQSTNLWHIIQSIL